MPRISQYTRQAPFEKAASPTISADFGTASTRALGSIGQAGSQISGLLEDLARKEAAAEGMSLQAEFATALSSTSQRYSDPKYLKNQFGTGPVTRFDETTGKLIEEPYDKKPIKSLTSEWAKEVQRDREQIFGKAKTIPRMTMAKLRVATDAQIARESLQISKLQVAMVQEQSDLAVYKFVESFVKPVRDSRTPLPPEKVQAIAEQVMETYDNAIATGALSDTAANKSAFEKMADDLETINQQKQEAHQTDMLYADLSLLPADDALSKLNKMRDVPEPVRSRVESRIRNQDWFDKRKLEETRETERYEIFGMLNDGNFAQASERLEMGTSFMAGEHQQFIGLVKDFGESVSKGKLTKYMESNPETQVAILKSIDLEPNKVSLTDIYSLVGKGLSIADTMNYVDRLNRNSKPDAQVKRSSVKSVIKRLEEYEDLRIRLIKAEGLEPKEEEERIRQEFLSGIGRTNSFDKWLEEDARSDEEINKQLDILTEPEREELKLSWYQGWFTRKSKEPLLLAEYKIEELTRAGIWQRWSKAQQAEARKMLEQGRTRQDVIDKIRGTKTSTQKTTKQADPLGIR